MKKLVLGLILVSSAVSARMDTKIDLRSFEVIGAINDIYDTAVKNHKVGDLSADFLKLHKQIQEKQFMTTVGELDAIGDVIEEWVAEQCKKARMMTGGR